MKRLIMISILLSTASYAEVDQAWKTEARMLLNSPEYANSEIKVCVYDTETYSASDCVQTLGFERSQRIFDFGGFPPDEIYQPDLMGMDTKPAAGGSPVLDKILDRVSRVGSAKGKVKVHYEETTTKPNGEKTQVKADIEIEAQVGAASSEAPKQ